MKYLLIIFTVVSFGLVGQDKSKANVLTTKTKNEIVNTVSQLLLDNYIYTDTAKLMSSYILKQLAEGKYKSITDPVKFTDILNTDIATIIKDKHFQIIYNPVMEKKLLDNNQVIPTNTSQANYSNNNSGIRSIKILNGNIGLIELGAFVDTSYKSKEALKSALLFLVNTNAIIFDVRNNGGGSLEMVQFIISYFFEKKTHLVDRYSRPLNKLTEYWTVTDSAEKRFTDKPLYILTSSNTFSAAEEFSYNLKHLKRATIIGQTTAGAAHGTFEKSATNGVVVYIPYARIINAITKTDWEKVGVIPDININPEKAVEVAQEKIFENLLKSAKDSSSLFDLNWQYALLNSLNNPVIIDQETLKKFCGVYGERTFTMENGELYYQRVGKPKFKLTPMTNTIMKGNDFFKIEFIKNSDGNYDEIVAYYQDHRIEKAKRK